MDDHLTYSLNFFPFNLFITPNGIEIIDEYTQFNKKATNLIN